MSTATSLPYWALAAVLAIATASGVSALVTWALRSTLVSMPAQQRHRLLLLLAMAPLTLGSSVVLGVMLPSVPSLFTGVDHCASHDDTHIHLCFLHSPHEPLAMWGFACLAFILTYFGWQAAIGMLRLRRSQRLVRALLQTKPERVAEDCLLLQSPLQLCVTAGLWAPRVMVSRVLWDALDDSERKILLAHEREHIRRRDILVSLLARAAGAFHLPWARAWLLEELEIAAEQACDEASADAIGDRILVAQLLVRVARLQSAPVPRELGYAASFAGASLDRRVHGLVESRAAAPSSRFPSYLVWGLLAAPLLAAGELHHVAESILSFIVW